MQTKWALAFAPVGSYLLKWTGSDKPKLLTFALAGENSFLAPEDVLINNEPVLDHFHEGDILYCEMGGKAGPFLLRALERGVEIQQIPSFRLKVADSEEITDELIEESEETFEQREKKSLANRKKRVELVARLSREQPELFYQMMPVDPIVWRISVHINAYLSIQKNFRIKAQQRRNEMETYFTWLPPSNDRKPLEKIQELLANPVDSEYYLALEKQMLEAITKELPSLKIWTKFLEKINGIGPSLAGRLIAAIGNIHRFPKRDGFRSYCGFSVIDGHMQRFRRGADCPKHDPQMRQALWLYGQQIVRQGEKNPYNVVYLTKKEKYLADGKNRSKLHCHNMAIRSAASNFIDDLWAAYWKIVEAEGVILPDSVKHVLYPSDYGKKLS